MNREFLARIIKKASVAEDVCEIVLSLDSEEFVFKPGQYVWVVLPKLDYPDPRGERRAFSITSSNTEKHSITVLMRVSDSGYKKTLSNLPENSPLQIIGPFGSSYLISDQPQSIVMIAGGTGIAPFSGILRSLSLFPSKPKIKIVYCATSTETGCFTPDLDQICVENSISVIKHLGDFRENVLPPGIDFSNDLFLVCGPEAFVNSVYPVLSNKKVPPEKISLEQFYPSLSGNLTEEEFIQKVGSKNILFQAVQDTTNHVVVTDANGKIIFANEAAQKNTGFTVNEMRGNTPRLWGGLMPAEFYKNLWEKIHKSGGFEGQIVNRRKNGEIYYVIAHISSIFDQTKSIIGYIGTEEDISELVRLKVNLEEKNNDLLFQKTHIENEKIKDEALLLGIGEGVIVVDERGSINLINKAAEDMLLIKEQDVLGKQVTNVLVCYDLQGNRIPDEQRPVNLSLRSNRITSGDYLYERADKTKFIVHQIITPIILNNKLIGAIQIFRDITREKEIDRMKTDFISLASHQLRTPLSAMKWFSEMLITGDAGVLNSEQMDFVKNISDSNERMIDLVNSLLNISRIESGRIIVDPKPTDLQELARGVVDEMQEKIAEKRLTVGISVQENLPQINVDPKMLRQVYDNLVTNAVKYSNPGGQIRISISIKDDLVVSQIADNGLGIPKEEQSKIFERFFRGSNVIKVETGGTGLGLYLAKTIVESSGGKIGFESEIGKGTSFWFSLPLSGVRVKAGEVSLNS